MATKESLNRRLDKVISAANGDQAEPLRSEARLLLKELEEYIDTKIETAIKSLQAR
jgi:hypothetical protein